MTEPECLNHQRVFDGKVFAVDRDLVRTTNGREVTLDVIRHPKAVVLLPVPEAGHIVLVRQFRYAVNAWLWELPAGSVDEGETPEQAASRECHEEINKVPGTIVRLGALYPTPGYCDEEMVFFRLSDLQDPTGPAAVDEDEDIEVKIFDLRDARDMARSGEIVDMKTIVGLGMI
jgi:ADP-ribose pyrophosphatase